VKELSAAGLGLHSEEGNKDLNTEEDVKLATREMVLLLPNFYGSRDCEHMPRVTSMKDIIMQICSVKMQMPFLIYIWKNSKIINNRIQDFC
jgi:hypothetical protein